MSKILEVAVDNYESAVAAFKGGAQRIEVCSTLVNGGLTPTPGFLKQVKKINSGKIIVFCMLRCRHSNYVYSDEEINITIEDINILKQNGADGFVFGALLENGEIDLKKCKEVIKACHPLPVTFHRAFDLLANPLIQLETIIDLGFKRLLTSGQKTNADEGIELIKKLVEQAKNRIIIVPGAGVSAKNIKLLLEKTGALEYHGSIKITEDKQDSSNPNQSLGKLIRTDLKQVAEIVQIFNSTAEDSCFGPGKCPGFKL